MLGSNPGLLPLWHWQPDALTTRLDLIKAHIPTERNSFFCVRIFNYIVWYMPIVSWYYHIFCWCFRIHAAGGNVAIEPTAFKRKTLFPVIVRGYLDDISCIGSTPIIVLAFGSNVRKMQCCGSGSGSSFYLNADPDPDPVPGSQTNADP